MRVFPLCAIFYRVSFEPLNTDPFWKVQRGFLILIRAFNPKRTRRVEGGINPRPLRIFAFYLENDLDFLYFY